MKTISRYIMTLVALFAMTTGAWADGFDVKQISVPESWNGDETTVTTADLPGFKAVSLNEAEAWTGAPASGIAYLFYAFDGNEVAFCSFKDGQYLSGGSYAYPHKEIYSDESQAAFFYTYADPNAILLTYDKDNKGNILGASFDMPAFDATAEYELVRDMGYKVAFSGVPTRARLAKDGDGKFHFADGLTFQLLDNIDAANPKDITSAEGITFMVGEVEAVDIEGNTFYQLNKETLVPLADFLADAHLGNYAICAVASTGEYDGTVYSSEFTAVEEYDLTVKPANDFSKGKIDAVTVGTESVTIDANTGEATKTGIAPDTEVKIKAKRGYVIDKVEVKKGGAAAAKTITIGDMELTYADGDTWETIVSKNSDKIKTLAGGYIVQVAQPEPNKYRYIKVVLSNKVNPSDIIDPSKNYEWGTIEVYS